MATFPSTKGKTVTNTATQQTNTIESYPLVGFGYVGQDKKERDYISISFTDNPGQSYRIYANGKKDPDKKNSPDYIIKRMPPKKAR